MNSTIAAENQQIDLINLPFNEFLTNFQSKIKTVFEVRTDLNKLSIKRGLPPFVLREIMSTKFLSTFIPKEYGGRGNNFSEGIEQVAIASYESLPLGLMLGINWGLFLQPLTKYASHEVKKEVYNGFINQDKLGGLMITEPDHGSDALNMQTSYTENNGAFNLKGTKHWAGLTGWADYWLLTARKKNPDGSLQRDIDFFVCDNNKVGQIIEVEEYFENLGLYMIPYGRNKVDVTIPNMYKLQPHTTGISMMLDTLHRNRLLIPAMAMGFTKRMLDEAFAHCEGRLIGGKPLLEFDQVQYRLSRLQSSFTINSAFCAYAETNAALEINLLDQGIVANSLKAVSTDLMQESAQQLFQLNGAKAYKLDHLAGRAIVDSRPFQIFEGPNDILYIQAAEGLLKNMRKKKETSLLQYLKDFAPTTEAVSNLKLPLDITIDSALSQRKLRTLGQILGLLVSAQMVIKLGENNFNVALIDNALANLQQEIKNLLSEYQQHNNKKLVTDYNSDINWSKNL